MITNKYDFIVLISATNANPNGDPLNGNRPRENSSGLGEISDVALKRKIRNRLQDLGEKIFVQSDDNRIDEFESLKDRAEKILKPTKEMTKEEYAKKACEEWIDVRSFGQVFAFKAKKEKDEEGKGSSVGVRGPVSIHPAFSVDPVNIEDIQITKSVNSEPGKDKTSDTMGIKHRIDFGLYLTKGSINVQLAEKTGFNDQDAEKIHEALKTLFENDASSARPEGSMVVERVYWFKHNNQLGQYPSVKVHKTVKVEKKEDVVDPRSVEDYIITYTELDGLQAEIYSV